MRSATAAARSGCCGRPACWSRSSGSGSRARWARRLSMQGWLIVAALASVVRFAAIAAFGAIPWLLVLVAGAARADVRGPAHRLHRGHQPPLSGPPARPRSGALHRARLRHPRRHRRRRRRCAERGVRLRGGVLGRQRLRGCSPRSAAGGPGRSSAGTTDHLTARRRRELPPRDDARPDRRAVRWIAPGAVAATGDRTVGPQDGSAPAIRSLSHRRAGAGSAPLHSPA